MKATSILSWEVFRPEWAAGDGKWEREFDEVMTEALGEAAGNPGLT